MKNGRKTENEKTRNYRIRDFLALMSRSTKIKCSGIILLAAAGAALASTWPVRLGFLYNDIAGGEITTISSIAHSLTVFGFLYLLAEGIVILRRVLLDCIIASHEADVREKSVERLLKMPGACAGGDHSAERSAEINQGVAGLSQLIKIFCNDIFATILTAICTMAQIAFNAPPVMIGIIAAYLLFTVLISVFQIRSQNGIREQIIKKKNHLDGQVVQAISKDNMELIRSFDACDCERQRLRPVMLDISATEKTHHRYMGSFDTLKQVSKVGFQMLLLIASVLLIARGAMAPGMVITVCLLYQQLLRPIDGVYRFMDETASSVVKARALTELAEKGYDPVFSIESADKAARTDEILVEDTVFYDPSGAIPLASYDRIRIPAGSGDITAVSGGSGCGKSTLMKGLNRLNQHTGRITILGSDIGAYSQSELTNTILYLPQDTSFLVGTIRENLVYGLSRPVSDDELILALRRACLYDTLAARTTEAQNASCDAGTNVDPDQNTDVLAFRIGEKGAGLSGGEGKRLALARIFLRTPQIFVLDESTTGLDSDTIAAVLTNLEAYAAQIGAGIIHISHDQRVLDRCKTIIPLHNRLKTLPSPAA